MPGRKLRRSRKHPNLHTAATVEKKRKAFYKKMKKEARKLRTMGMAPKTVSKKMGIPNLCPFKEDLLRKALHRRHELKEELEQKKKEKKTKRQVRKEMIARGQANQVLEFKDGINAPKAYQNGDDTPKLMLPRNKKEHRNMYWCELSNVINQSDVVIEVLDARDPMGCRSEAVERRILSGKANVFGGHKKLILLLNKIDLIPYDVLTQWMKYLRREHPVIAFKASTQSQNRKLQSNMSYTNVTYDQTSLKQKGVVNQCIGAEALINLLKNYSRSLNLQTPITVGFIGYPNTGKSSVINSLKRTQAVGTSSVPGFTKQLAEVKLDSTVKLIDSPGVILNKNEQDTRLVLRNALKISSVDSVEAVVNHILKCIPFRKIASIYGLTNKEIQQSLKTQFSELTDNDPNNLNDDTNSEEPLTDSEKFLYVLSQKLKHIQSGGIPDIPRTAARILQDWNAGKIAYYVTPPAIIESDTQVKFVQQFDKEFDIDALMNESNNQVLETLKTETQKQTTETETKNQNKNKNKNKKSINTEDRYVAVNPDLFQLCNAEDDQQIDNADLEMIIPYDQKEEHTNQLSELDVLQNNENFKRKKPQLNYAKDSNNKTDIDGDHLMLQT